METFSSGMTSILEGLNGLSEFRFAKSLWSLRISSSQVVEGQAAGQGFTANNIRKLAASHSEPWKKDFMDKLVRLHEKSKKSKMEY
jgi:hypothetical protein